MLYAYDIQWDCDEEDDAGTLPSIVPIPQGLTDEEEISDYLSDLTGFCHKGFTLSDESPKGCDNIDL